MTNHTVMDQYRDTGRTTRLLRDVIKNARKGERYIVLAIGEKHREQLEKALVVICADEGAEWLLRGQIEVRRVNDKSILSNGHGQWRVIGDTHKVVADHFTIESIYHHVLAAWLDQL